MSSLRPVLAILAALYCLWPQARAQAGPPDDKTGLVGHGGPVKAITTDATGRYVLTGSFDYSAILWELAPGKKPRLLNRFADHDSPVNSVAFIKAPDRFVSAGDDGDLYLWRTRPAKLLHRFKGHRNKVLSIAISPGKRLAASASWDRTIRLWDLKTLKPAGVLKGHTGPVNAVLFSADGRFLYSGSYDGSIAKWDVRTGQMIRPLHRHGWGINVMAWLPGKRKILFGAINGDVQVFDLDKDRISKILIPHQRPVLALAISRDGTLLASSGAGGIIRVWRLADWSVVEELHSAFGPVWAMAFIDNRHMLYAGLDDFAANWKISPRDMSKEGQGTFPRRFQKNTSMSLGERQFNRKCSVCHTLRPQDANRAGPSLYGVFGRRAGSLAGYPYSPDLKRSAIIWTEKNIDRLFRDGPQVVTPGSKMPLQRISDTRKREALIKFLRRKAMPEGMTSK
ncbi:MAG TPA: cytochrome C [Rhizobiales bacterium]|nr:cytochrome C [Hyphomicrobiales bacterium]